VTPPTGAAGPAGRPRELVEHRATVSRPRVVPQKVDQFVQCGWLLVVGQQHPSIMALTGPFPEPAC